MLPADYLVKGLTMLARTGTIESHHAVLGTVPANGHPPAAILSGAAPRFNTMAAARVTRYQVLTARRRWSGQS